MIKRRNTLKMGGTLVQSDLFMQELVKKNYSVDDEEISSASSTEESIGKFTERKKSKMHAMTGVFDDFATFYSTGGVAKNTNRTCLITSNN